MVSSRGLEIKSPGDHLRISPIFNMSSLSNNNFLVFFGISIFFSFLWNFRFWRWIFGFCWFFRLFYFFRFFFRFFFFDWGGGFFFGFFWLWLGFTFDLWYIYFDFGGRFFLKWGFFFFFRKLKCFYFLVGANFSWAGSTTTISIRIRTGEWGVLN